MKTRTLTDRLFLAVAIPLAVANTAGAVLIADAFSSGGGVAAVAGRFLLVPR